MPKMFGTDGVRGLANRDLTARLALDLGDAAVRVLGDAGTQDDQPEGRRRALVGRDTRVSGDFLASALSAGMAAGGFDVIDAGIIPTPGIAFLTSDKIGKMNIMLFTTTIRKSLKNLRNSIRKSLCKHYSIKFL